MVDGKPQFYYFAPSFYHPPNQFYNKQLTSDHNTDRSTRNHYVANHDPGQLPIEAH